VYKVYAENVCDGGTPECSCVLLRGFCQEAEKNIWHLLINIFSIFLPEQFTHR